MSIAPIATRTMVLEIKYGKIMSANPQTIGTAAFCFLPYTKNPSPIEPKSNPQRSQDSFNSHPSHPRCARACILTVNERLLSARSGHSRLPVQQPISQSIQRLAALTGALS